MAACNFSFSIQDNATLVLQNARSAVRGHGGQFEGDEQAGSFRLTVLGSTIAGSYFVAGQSIDIVVSDKPFLLPCGTIESFLKSQLGI